MWSFIRRHWLFLFACLFLIFFCLLPLFCVYGRLQTPIRSIENVEAMEVGIVFGAGLGPNGSPSDMLGDRLALAAQLYHLGKIKRILVSGDNSTPSYSEPDVMKEWLVQVHEVPKEDIFADYAGRRTYDTCARAHALWGIEEAILITQKYHLPRALWTCQKLGIHGQGVSATLQPYLRDKYFKLRELAAIYKAFVDIYVWHPVVMGGAFESDLDP